MSLDLAALADRFKRAGQVALLPAEAPTDPPVTGRGPTVYSNSAEPAPRAAVQAPTPGPSTLPAAVRGPAPEGPSSRRRPRRRRWLPPSSPAERQADPVDPPPAELHPCSFCGERHQPIRLEQAGIFAPYRQPIAAASWETNRPRPLGLTATQQAALIRDQHSAWRMSPAAEPIPPGSLTLRERLAGWWQGDDPTT